MMLRTWRCWARGESVPEVGVVGFEIEEVLLPMIARVAAYKRRTG
jgi:hypothetical protein